MKSTNRSASIAFLRIVTAAEGIIGVIGIRVGLRFIVLPFFAGRRTDSSRHRAEPAEAKQVVGCPVQMASSCVRAMP